LKALAISHARAHKPDKILIEDAGVGTALVRELQDAGLTAIGVKPMHDKLTRMSIQSGKFASGQVFFPNYAPWLADFESELFAFPNGRHDDQVDSTGQALAHEISGFRRAPKLLDLCECGAVVFIIANRADLHGAPYQNRATVRASMALIAPTTIAIFEASLWRRVW
jgi:predicted phage terminase large subunit-like protein